MCKYLHVCKTLPIFVTSNKANQITLKTLKAMKTINTPARVSSIAELDAKTDYFVYGDNVASYEAEIAKILKREHDWHRTIKVTDVDNVAIFEVASHFYGTSGRAVNARSVYRLKNGRLCRDMKI